MTQRHTRKSARGRVGALRLTAAGCLAACLIASSAWAAPTWTRRLGTSGTSVAIDIASTADGGAIAAGTHSEASDIDGLLLRLTTDGDIAWGMRYGTDGRDALNGVVELGGGAWAADGWTQGPGFSSHAGWVLSFDDLGNILWDREIRGTSFVECRAIARAPNGSLIVSGAVSRATVDQPFVLGMSPVGTLLWQVNLLTTERTSIIGAVGTADGGVVLVGETEVAPTAAPYAWIAKLDAQHALAWVLRLGDGDATGSLEDVLELPSGDLVAVGGWHRPGTGRIGEALWLEFSPEGVLQRQRVYGPSTGKATSIEPMPDGGYMLVGYGTGLRAELLRLNAEGLPSWIRLHGGTTWTTGADLTPDGEVLGSGGMKLSRAGAESWCWIVKTDPLGDIADPCPSPLGYWAVEDPSLTVTLMSSSAVDPGFVASQPSGLRRMDDVFTQLPTCPPGEATRLLVARVGAGVLIDWLAAPDATTHELYRGLVGLLPYGTYGHDAIGACALPAPSHLDPVAGDGVAYYYLAVGRNDLGAGPYGFDSLGGAIPSAVSACP